jgi:hypothetical protein
MTGFDWQWLACAASIAVAAVYVARQTWSTWNGRRAGCGGCSCATKTTVSAGQTLIPSTELTRRLRRD